MDSNTSTATPELNRLRAASGLIPIIKAGLANKRVSLEKAAYMASFCEWAASCVPASKEEASLVANVTEGLRELKATLSAVDRTS
jgi:hypothetical protein